MKSKSTYVLIGLTAFLGIVVYFLFHSPEEREASYSIAAVHLNMDSASVQTISITRNNSTFALQDIGARWYVVNSERRERRYPADENAIRTLLGSVQKLRIVSLISSNPERQHLFEVDATGTLLVLADRGGKTVSFHVGKMGPSFSETYIRPANSNDVFLAEGISSWDVNKELKDWRDKVIVHLQRDSVRHLSFRYPRHHFMLLRDSVWQIQPSGKESVSESAITSFLGSLESLRATDFVDSTIDLPPPQLSLEVALRDPVILHFIPIPPDSSKYWVSGSATDQIFTVNKWNVQPLLKQRKDFLLP